MNEKENHWKQAKVGDSRKEAISKEEEVVDKAEVDIGKMVFKDKNCQKNIKKCKKRLIPTKRESLTINQNKKWKIK